MFHDGTAAAAAAKLLQSCPTPCDPVDGSPPGWTLDSPGKNTGMGCHFLLQCMKVKSESEVAQSCPTLCDPMDCSLPGSSVHGIFQARVLEWGAIAFSSWWNRASSYSFIKDLFRKYLVVRTQLLPLQEAQVQSIIRKLWSHMLCTVTQKKKKIGLECEWKYFIF